MTEEIDAELLVQAYENIYAGWGGDEFGESLFCEFCGYIWPPSVYDPVFITTTLQLPETYNFRTIITVCYGCEEGLLKL